MKTLAFINRKGGVGKTVSAVSVAYILADTYNKRVLLVDCDATGSATTAYNRVPETLNSPTTNTLLIDVDADIRAVIQKTDYPNVDIIPANGALESGEKAMLLDVQNVQQEHLKDHLSRVADDYDYCVLDCPPTLSLIAVNALVCADEVYIPTIAEKKSVEGVAAIIEAVGRLRRFSPNIVIKGVFVTMYQRAKVNAEVERQLVAWGLPVLPHIRFTTKVKDASFDELLPKYAPICTATQDYMALTATILGVSEDEKECEDNGEA